MAGRKTRAGRPAPKRSPDEARRLAEKHALTRAVRQTRELADLGKKLQKAIEIADAVLKVLREVLAQRDAALEPVRARYEPTVEP